MSAWWSCLPRVMVSWGYGDVHVSGSLLFASARRGGPVSRAFVFTVDSLLFCTSSLSMSKTVLPGPH